MLPILPARPGIGALIGAGLGQGIRQGISTGADYMMKVGLERAKHQQALDFYNKLNNQETQQSIKPEQKEESFINLLNQNAPQMEELLGRELTPQDLNELWSAMRRPQDMQTATVPSSSENMYSKAAALKAAGFKGPGDIMREKARMEAEHEWEPQKAGIGQEAKRTADFVKEIDTIKSDLPNINFNLGLIEEAMPESGTFSAGMGDVMAKLTGNDWFRTAAAKEAQSGTKNYFLSDLQAIKGGKINMLLESNILDAYAKAGTDPISAQKILLGMRLKRDIMQAKSDAYDELADPYVKSGKALPMYFKDRARERYKEKALELEKKAINQMKQLSNIEEQRDKIYRKYLKPGEMLFMSPQGEPYAVPKKEQRAYREKGYLPLGVK